MPQTLAQMVREKHAGVYDDLTDHELDTRVRAKYPGVYDDLPTEFGAYRAPNSKPASAEDFAPAKRDVSVGNMLMNAVKSIPSGIVDTAKLLYNDQRPEDVALGPGRVLAPLVRAAGAGAASEAGKVMASKTLSETIGHSLAASLPLIGPAAAAAGEDIGSGDTERIERGGGNAIGLVGGMLAPAVAGKVAPRVSPALATIGEQLAAKGKSVAAKAGPVAMEVAKTLPVELAAHYLGGPLGSGVVARALLKNVLDSTRKAAPAAEASAETAPNAGGRVVTAKAPTLTQELTDALAETRVPDPPARVTTPPEASLPPGYTPRATVPKARQAKAKLPPQVEEAMAAGERKRAYFLKSPEEMAVSAEDAVEPTGSLTVGDLPASWRTHTGQDLFPIIGEEGRAVIDGLRAELKARGMSTGQAIASVSKNRSLPTEVRAQLLRALSGGK